MNDIETKFELDGFAVVDGVLNSDELVSLTNKCDVEIKTEVGTRNLLNFDWVQELAHQLVLNESLKTLMPKNAVVVQCNYFSKDAQSNWSVPPHRDLSIPVKKKISAEAWSGWSYKEGVLYAQPPKEILAKMLAVRLHLEDNNSENGALEVVAGSHKNFNQKGQRRLCIITQGGVLVMRPLILHSSAKLKSGRRRVLHFVFGPEKLPDDMQWSSVI